MNDMREVIVPKSDQINADHLLAGPITITITEVTIRPRTEQPVSIHFEGDDGKPYKPCLSMARVMVHCWGDDANKYVGRSMTLFCDPKVKWGGLAVGGIRISHMSHIKGAVTMALTETKGNKKPFTVKPLAEPVKPPSNAPEPTQTWATTLGNRLLAEKNGPAWLTLLLAELPTAPTREDAEAAAALYSVRETLKSAPPRICADIEAALQAAVARFDAPTTTGASDWAGPDVPPDDAAAAALGRVA